MVAQWLFELVMYKLPFVYVKYIMSIIPSRRQILAPTFTYRVIHKFLQEFRPLRYSSRDGHAEGEYANRGRDTPNFCLTLQVLDMSTPGDAADVNPVIKVLPHTLQYLVVDSSDCLQDPSSQLW
jgi:hypothetical protein